MKTLVLLGNIAATIFCIVAVLSAIKSSYYKSFLPENHLITIGKVVDKAYSRMMVGYEYQDVDNKKLKGTAYFGERFKIGEHIVIWYLPEKPELSEWLPSGKVNHIPFGTILTDSAYAAIRE